MWLTLPGDPRPCPRHRHRAGGRGGYNPPWYDNQKTAWGLHARSQMTDQGAAKLKGRVGTRLYFFRATRRHADLDNLIKSVWDALNGIAFEDDRQIDRVSARVYRGVGGASARVEIQVYELTSEWVPPNWSEWVGV